MPNKYHNGKLSAGKAPGLKSGANHAVSHGDSTANWKTNIGPTGPNRNKVGSKQVKTSVKSAY